MPNRLAKHPNIKCLNKTRLTVRKGDKEWNNYKITSLNSQHDLLVAVWDQAINQVRYILFPSTWKGRLTVTCYPTFKKNFMICKQLDYGTSYFATMLFNMAYIKVSVTYVNLNSLEYINHHDNSPISDNLLCPMLTLLVLRPKYSLNIMTILWLLCPLAPCEAMP